MSKNKQGFLKRRKAIERLEQELARFSTSDSLWPIREYEMLSLMVNEAENGVDISERYPHFYKELLDNPDLREAFLDSLESLEKSKKDEPALLPSSRENNLDFLKESLPHASVKKLGKKSWRLTWQRSVEQLQTLFSPPELAYRSDPSLYDDPWITILRDEFEIEGASLTVLLECSLSPESNISLACALNIAANSENAAERLQTKVQALLRWGEYDQSLPLNAQGRFRFPDIPFDSVLDKAHQNIRSSLELTLETLPPT